MLWRGIGASSRPVSSSTTTRGTALRPRLPIGPPTVNYEKERGGCQRDDCMLWAIWLETRCNIPIVLLRIPQAKNESISVTSEKQKVIHHLRWSKTNFDNSLLLWLRYVYKALILLSSLKNQSSVKCDFTWCYMRKAECAKIQGFRRQWISFNSSQLLLTSHTSYIFLPASFILRSNAIFESITGTWIFVAWSGPLVSSIAVSSSEGGLRIGTRAIWLLYSTTTGQWTLSPGLPSRPLAINCESNELVVSFVDY